MAKKTRRKAKAKAKEKISVPAPGPNQCHPRVGKENSENGCLPINILEKAAKHLRIDTLGGSTRNQNKKKTLKKKIVDVLGVNLAAERSLLNALPLTQEEKTQLASQYLRPAMPEEWKGDPDMWLDSNNIRDVMKQYEEARPDFKFLGPYPIDFASQDPNTPVKGECLIDEMCELNLKKEQQNGKNSIGIVYNLDPHYKNGSHWVANYIDIPNKRCYYFDSYGMKPPKQIYKFMQWLTLQEPKMNLGWNGRRFQHQNSECGMYSMYFIDRMLAGDPFLKFCRRAPPDRIMLDFRDWMFST
jgi:hypothetical protein